jgi:hydrogenase/urease accessory protein HupE
VAFGLAAAIFVTLLISASVLISSAGTAVLKPVRTSGPTVKRFSGFVLVAVGIWFVFLAFVPSPIVPF